MAETLSREFIYIAYYFSIQFGQIFKFWLLGMAVGSLVSVFGKKKIHEAARSLSGKSTGAAGIVCASALGILSPLCMYGTVPIAASFRSGGMREDWLAAFMMSSVLLNPQLIIYSAALGKTALAVRIVSCFLCGAAAGVLVKRFGHGKFFDFQSMAEPENHDTDPNMLLRLLKNFARNVKATGPYFLVGILLAALFRRYVSADFIASVFGADNRFGVFMAATVGVPLYVCGGGTIPLLQEWLRSGMSLGAASSFMLTGPATKITNLGALKIVLGKKSFALYIAFCLIFSFLTGLAVNAII